MSSMAGLDSVILKKLICEKVWMDTWTDRQIDKKKHVFVMRNTLKSNTKVNYIFT